MPSYITERTVQAEIDAMIDSMTELSWEFAIAEYQNDEAIADLEAMRQAE